jgi:predicted nucleic-acid-binding Zn-ribbon protein
MKKGYYCPACGNREAMKLALTTAKGKSLSVMLASQGAINKPDVQICCLKCRHVANADSFRAKRC